LFSQPSLSAVDTSGDSYCSISVLLNLDTNWQRNKLLCYQNITYKKRIVCFLLPIVGLLTGYIDIIYLPSRLFLRSLQIERI